METEIKIFKLNYDGTFDDISHTELKDAFTITSIIAIYINKERTMYSWIGNNASQSLMNHIPRLRVIIKEEFPEFRIIRYITIGMRDEPFDFFEKLNIVKDELHTQIEQQEEMILPVLKQIKGFEEESEQMVNKGNYEDAITKLGESIKLAKDIKDEALETEQKRKISEITENHVNRRIVSEVQEEALKVRRVFYDFLDREDNFSAHRAIKDFKAKYEKIYDLALNSSAKALIKKDKEMRQKEIVQYKSELNQLEYIFKSSIQSNNLIQAGIIIEKVHLISDFIGHPSRVKWNELEQQYIDLKESDNKQNDFKEVLKELEIKFETVLESYNFKEADTILKKANSILSEVNDNKVKSTWSDLKTLYAKTQRKKVVIAQIDSFLLRSPDLKKQYNFDELNGKSSELLKKAEDLELFNHVTKLEKLKEDVVKKQNKYDQILADIAENGKTLQSKRKSEDLMGALLDCENLIKLSESILNDSLAKEYSEISKEIKNEIAEKQAYEEIQQKLNEDLSQIKVHLKTSIESLDIQKAKDEVMSAKRILPNIDDVKVKEEWILIEKDLAEAKEKKTLIDKIEVFLPRSTELLEENKFEEVKDIVNDLSSKSENLELPEYLKKLKNAMENAINSEETYKENKLKKKISKIQIEINDSLNTLDLSKSNKLIEEGDSLIDEALKAEIRQQWDDFKREFNEAKQLKILIEEIQDFLRETPSLKQKLLFNELYSKIDGFLKQLEGKDADIFITILEDLRNEIKTAQLLYEKLNVMTEDDVRPILFELDESEKIFQVFVPHLKDLLVDCYISVDAKSFIIYGKLQDVIYFYKDLVSDISTSVKNYLNELVKQFELKYKDILKETLKKLLLHLPPMIVDEGVEKLYKEGVQTIEDFYKNHIVSIEIPFLNALAEVTTAEEENKAAYCEIVNLKLAQETFKLFKDLEPQLLELIDKIGKGLKHFELDVLPKTFKAQLTELISKSLSKISRDLNRIGR